MNGSNTTKARRVHQLERDLIRAAEAWFETITGGRYDDIPNKQFVLLQIIEEYREMKS